MMLYIIIFFAVLIGASLLFRPQYAVALYIVSIGVLHPYWGWDMVGAANLDSVLLVLGVGYAFLAARGQKLRIPGLKTPGLLGKILLIYWVSSLVGNTMGLITTDVPWNYFARQMMKDAAFLLFILFLEIMLSDERMLRWVYRAACVACILATLSVLSQYCFPDLPIWSSDRAQFVGESTEVFVWGNKTGLRGESSRNSGFMGTPPKAGMMCLCAISIGLGWLGIGRGKWAILGLILTSASFVSLAVTQSRSAMAGTAFMVVAWVFLAPMKHRIGQRIWILLLPLLFAIILFVVNPEEILGKLMRRFTQEGDATGLVDYSRIAIYERHFNVMGARSLTGIGYTGALLETGGAAGHSSLMDAVMDGGVVGFFCILSLFYFVFQQHIHRRRMEWSVPEWNRSSVMFVSSVGLLTFGLTQAWTTDFTIRLFTGIWLCLALAPYWRLRGQFHSMPHEPDSIETGTLDHWTMG